MSGEGPDPRAVEKFTTPDEDGEQLDPGIVPVASLVVLWFVEPDGSEGVVTKFDGQQRVSVTVGDLMGLVHQYLAHDAAADE